MSETFEYCLKQGILGVGWRIKTIDQTDNWENFYTEASKIYDNLNQCVYIKTHIERDSLVWTRDTNGDYYIAKVLTGWRYFTNEYSREKNIDIGNVFSVSFKKLRIDEVPGKIVACFMPSLTMQKIIDPTAVAYSKFIWNKYAGEDYYTVDKAVSDAPDIFSLLDFEEIEDLIFLYLQKQGWFVVPHSRKANTMAFEYEVIRPESNIHAHVQVKTGADTLKPSNYKDRSYPVILFQANDRYIIDVEDECSNVTCLSRSDVENFIKDSGHWLPARYRNKIEMLQQKQKA